MSPPERQVCPICDAAVAPNPRYPNHLCNSCATRATAPDGRPLNFFNESLSGGYLVTYADSGERYDSHDCVVDGRACRADEARFGGIVIEPVRA